MNYMNYIVILGFIIIFIIIAYSMSMSFNKEQMTNMDLDAKQKLDKYINEQILEYQMSGKIEK